MMTMPSETVLPTVAMADDDDNDDSPPVDPADDDAVASLLGMSDNAEVDVPVPGAAPASFADASNSYLPVGIVLTNAMAPSDHSTANKDDGRSHSDDNTQSVTGNHHQQGMCSSSSNNNINNTSDTTTTNNNNNVNTTVSQKASSVAVPPSLQTTASTAPPPSLLQQLQIENLALREKNDKLKSLLGRSAKAQRDAKHELERTKRLYESIKVENEKLDQRVEALANRPTHMDLLADFEANFDRALLSIGNNSGGNNGGQSGGEDAAEDSSPSSPNVDGANASFVASFSSNDDVTTSATTPEANLLLLAEIDEANSQIANLESINAALQHRYNELEKSLAKECKSLNDMCAILRLELRGAKSDSEKWERECRMALVTMEEMHLEVDLATKAAAEANRRASYAELGMRMGGTVLPSSSSMRGSSGGGAGGEGGGSQQPIGDYVAGLEAKVAALQEWALASAESKRLTAERCMELEERVRELEGQGRSSYGDGEDCSSTLLTSSDLATYDHDGSSPSNMVIGNADSSALVRSLGRERKLWNKSSSLVVGAGMVGHAILELGPVFVEPSETVLLRWKFDITPADLDIDFSVLKGMCEDTRARRGADACLRVRRVKGGGGGDVGGAFARQNACTMVWSNEMSWVWPRTVKWTAEAVAIGWSD